MKTVRSGFHWLIGLKEVTSEPEYAQAVDFEESFLPRDDRDYEWIWKYAEDSYARLERVFKEFDDKAGSIIQYLGGGAGLFTLGAIATTTQDNVVVVLCALPSLILALFAILNAAVARIPARVPLPPAVEGAVKYVEAFDQLGKAAFLGQWHLACEGLRLALRFKARRVMWATRLYVVALLTLLLPLFVAIARAII